MRLVFGPFELDPNAGELTKSGTRIRLPSQPCKVLSMLLAHPGEVVATDELRRQLWDDGTFVDFEHGLHAAINKLRRALGDSASKPRYIETLPGRGYRFVGAVEHRLPPPKVADAPPVTPVTSNPQKYKRFRGPSGKQVWSLAGIVVTLLAVVVLTGLLRVHHGARQPVVSLELDPPEDAEFAFGTDSAGVALSPDGQLATYVASYRGSTSLWVRSLGGGTGARQIPGTEGANVPFWSPDGRSIAFFAGGKLQRVEEAGGTPQTICETGPGASGSWGENGQIIFAAWHSGLYTISASGGTPTALTTVDKSRQQIFHSWPQFLPGGKFLYYVRSRKREDTGAYAAALSDPQKAIQVVATETNALYAPVRSGEHRDEAYLLWLNGTSLVAQEFNSDALTLQGFPHRIADPVARLAPRGEILASASENGMLIYRASAGLRQLTWVDRTGKPQESLGEPSVSSHFRLSPNGARVVATRHNGVGTDLWVLDVQRGIWTRLTWGVGMSIYPVWSPDSREVLFASDVPFNLFRKDTNASSAERRLTKSSNPQFPMDWSSDGRFLLYEQDDPTGARRSLWVLPTMPPNATPHPYVATPFNAYMGRISPDNHWAVFQSDETGRYEIYVDTFPEPHGKLRISTSGGTLPRWSAGGHEVLYVSPDFRLMAVKLNSGPRPVPAPPQPLFSLPVVDPDLSPYEVSSDGQRFLLLETVKHGASLKVILDWPVLVDGDSRP